MSKWCCSNSNFMNIIGNRYSLESTIPTRGRDKVLFYGRSWEQFTIYGILHGALEGF